MLVTLASIVAGVVYLYEPRRARRRKVEATLATVGTFLERAGGRSERTGAGMLRIKKAPGRLAPATPVLVMAVPGEPTREEVERLTARAKSRDGRAGTALLIYGDPPALTVRAQLAEARSLHHVAIIPLPLAEIERALLENAALAKLDEYAGRYQEGADLFADANAIGDTLSFFGREKLLRDLVSDLRAGQSVGLFGLRKSGKTSVLRQIEPMLAGGFVEIDLQTKAGNPHFGLAVFFEILQKLSARVGGTDALAGFPSDGPAGAVAGDFSKRFTDLVQALASEGTRLPLVCAFDEIDVVLPTPARSPEWAQEFNICFGTLRSLCQQQRNLAIVVIDVHPDANRINHWTQAGVPPNPLFSFLKETFVQPFDAKETREMLEGISGLMNLHFDPETLDAVHRLSGGHAFVSRQLASLLYQEISPRTDRKIPWGQTEPLLSRALEYSTLLARYIGGSIWEDREAVGDAIGMRILKVLAFAESEPVPEASLISELPAQGTRNSFFEALAWLIDVGLVVRERTPEGDRYRIGLPLLAQWLQDNTPDRHHDLHERPALR